MATLQINGITLGCTPDDVFDVLVEYKLVSDPTYATLSSFPMNPDGTFVSPVQITGLDASSCYDIRLTADLSFVCQFEVESCTEPFFEWIADDQECETEGGFGEVKQITLVSSPARSWLDPDTNRLYIADIDDPAGNIYWFTDVTTATTGADAVHSAAVSFDPIWNMYFDELYRRVYLVGDNTNGLIVYDIDLDTASTVLYGTNGSFQRTALFVAGNIIICNNGNDDVVLIARDTLTISATIPTNTITNPEHFDNGPYKFVMPANGNLYVVSQNADASSVGVYDTSLNHITEITLPGAFTWSFGNYWQDIYYDITSDRIYVSDTGSNSRYVINPNTNTVLDTRQNLNTENKSNMAMTFSVDTLTDNLYAKAPIRNSSSDPTSISRVYRIDRTTFDFTNMYEGATYGELTAIPSLGWFIGTDVGGLNAGGDPNYDTDGTITVLSNSVGSSNTGTLLTLTLQEVTDPGGVPTGETKPNVPDDPDYIAPVTDTITCPLAFDLACPTDAMSTFYGSGELYGEFAISNAVRFNPAVDNIAVYAYNTTGPGREGSPIIFPDPTLTNYYDVSFTGLAAIDYTIEIVYRSAVNAELATCVVA